MTSQSGIGQQVTQRTTQQGRPQIRILVTCRQVVNAYQDDRVKDDDLTKKHYLLSGTHGTEQMPRSAVFLALCVSAVLFFYDGGGGDGSGEVLCHRLVCHRPNEVTTDARLDFIANESLGIDPAVELGGVAVPFHKTSVRLPTLRRCSTDSTRYTLSMGTDTFCSSGS